MKKLIALLLAIILCVSLCACSKADDDKKQSEDTVSVDTDVETDIIRLTITNAQLAIKLNDSDYDYKISEDYFNAEKYDSSKHAGADYVAPKGHTYVAIEFRVKNLDRAPVTFEATDFITVKYAGEEYKESINYGCRSEDGYVWEKFNKNVSTLTVDVEETIYYRGYIDIPTDAESLDDDFYLTVTLPNSKDETEDFVYFINDAKLPEEHIVNYEEASYCFHTDIGQEYFSEHLSEYTKLSSDEIKSLIEDTAKCDIYMKLTGGCWKGSFEFESDHRIKETIYDGSVGYFNNRTWKISGDNLILSDEDVCDVYDTNLGDCLLVKDNEPYALLTLYY